MLIFSFDLLLRELLFSQLILILYHKYPLMSNRNRKGESVLRFYIFKVLLNVIRRKKRGKREREEEEEEGRGRGKREEGEGRGKREREEGRGRGKREEEEEEAKKNPQEN